MVFDLNLGMKFYNLSNTGCQNDGYKQWLVPQFKIVKINLNNSRFEILEAMETGFSDMVTMEMSPYLQLP